MAFPFLSEADFEAGGNDHFDSKVDTQSKLTTMHYSDMALIPGLPSPWSGAYALVSDLSKGTATAYLQEDTSWDITVPGTIFFRFFLYISNSLVMANNDEFQLLVLQSTGPVDEDAVVINFTTANGLRIGIGQSAGAQFLTITKGAWHCVEVKASPAAAAAGTLDMWLDGASATQVTGLTNATIIQGRFGTMGIDAGTTQGFIVMDHLIADDLRLFPVSISQRWSLTPLSTANGHAFVGPGRINNVSLYSGAATDNVTQLFDTDTGDTSEQSRLVVEIKNTSNNQTVDKTSLFPYEFRRGCFVNMTGTNPRAQVTIGRATAFGSDGRVRQFGFNRKREVGNQ